MHSHIPLSTEDGFDGIVPIRVSSRTTPAPKFYQRPRNKIVFFGFKHQNVGVNIGPITAHFLEFKGYVGDRVGGLRVIVALLDWTCVCTVIRGGKITAAAMVMVNPVVSDKNGALVGVIGSCVWSS